MSTTGQAAIARSTTRRPESRAARSIGASSSASQSSSVRSTLGRPPSNSPDEQRVARLLVERKRPEDGRVPVCDGVQPAALALHRQERDELAVAADRDRLGRTGAEGAHPGEDPARTQEGRAVDPLGKLLPFAREGIEVGRNAHAAPERRLSQNGALRHDITYTCGPAGAPRRAAFALGHSPKVAHLRRFARPAACIRPAETLERLCHRAPGRRADCHAAVAGADLDVLVRARVEAGVPVDDAVAARVDGHEADAGGQGSPRASPRRTRSSRPPGTSA